MTLIILMLLALFIRVVRVVLLKETKSSHILESRIYSTRIPKPSLFTISVYAWRRTRSLERTLASLVTSQLYYNVSLVINLDGGYTSEVEQLCSTFKWPYGPKIIRRSPVRKGMPAAILHSCINADPEHIVLHVEDDVELSPHYSALIKAAFSSSGYDTIQGVSLYNPKVNEVTFKSSRDWNPDKFSLARYVQNVNNPWILFELPCSWGCAYKNKAWWLIQVMNRLRAHMSSESIFPELRSNSWRRSWKRFAIELFHVCSLKMLYYAPGRYSLATNYFEPGEHSGEQPSSSYNQVRTYDYRFTVPLLRSPSTFFTPTNISALNAILVTHDPSTRATAKRIPRHLRLDYICR